MSATLPIPKRTAAGILAAATLWLAAGCCTVSPTLSRFEFQQPHMGTLFTITLYAPDEVTARVASDAAFAKVAALNAMMSDYDAESELMRLCRQPVGQPVRISSELFEVLDKSLRLAALSEGAFDVTVGPVVRQWRRARRVGELPPPAQLARARAAVGWQKLTLDARNHTVTLHATNMQLDLGGIAKGFAADAALAVLKARGCPTALVAAAGDIAAGEAPPGKRGWRVSIGVPDSSLPRASADQAQTRPEHRAPFARTLLLKNAAVSTSGDAEQFVEIDGVRYSHIVDPRTGVGLTNQLQVTVVSRCAKDTDAFATAVCVLGIEHGLKLVEAQPGMAALILRKREAQWEVIESRRLSGLGRVE